MLTWRSAELRRKLSRHRFCIDSVVSEVPESLSDVLAFGSDAEVEETLEDRYLGSLIILGCSFEESV